LESLPAGFGYVPAAIVKRERRLYHPVIVRVCFHQSILDYVNGRTAEELGKKQLICLRETSIKSSRRFDALYC
jgi:hypothetical protein